MAVKYVKDFSFPASGGFHGDVQRFAKGGHVTKVPAKAKASAKDMPARAKPNAPAKGASKMESKPKMGKGQGYAEGGRVPGYDMDRLPAKKPPGRTMDLAPSKPERGQYQGYAKGGGVSESDIEDMPGFSLRDPRSYNRQPMSGGRYMAKGGKVAKVMREYKEGKLHSGSKKGPLVKNREQAVAIALSEARKAGAKIPKKAEGGIFTDEAMAYQSKGPKTRYTPAKGRREARERAMERRAREAMERAEKFAPGMSLDMPDRKADGGMMKEKKFPDLTGDGKVTRADVLKGRGVFKHGGMSAHRRKPMYGGGKC